VRRLIPYPLLTLALLLLWLVLNDSIESAHLLLGLLMGLLGGAVYARLQPRPAKQRGSWASAAKLMWQVLVDIVHSNIAVAQIALRLRAPARVAGFLEIALQLRDPRGLAVLACIVTATPGTSWAHYDAAANVLTLHVLDLPAPVDQAAWVGQFKNRYERALMEIFE
jgi:multicomponent K+:H+ antiporter subunit E